MRRPGQRRDAELEPETVTSKTRTTEVKKKKKVYYTFRSFMSFNLRYVLKGIVLLGCFIQATVNL